MRSAAVLLAALLGTFPAAAQTSPARVDVAGARSPAFAADGRLVVSIAGDLWVLQPDGDAGWDAALQLTTGHGWDRDPAWTTDGAAIIFASDRAGTIDLWRVDVPHAPVNGASSTPRPQPVRLTTSAEQDLEPSVAPGGDIVFARGRAGDMDLWILRPDGSERRLTTEPGGEREPAWSPDGSAVAYVAVRAGRRELRVRQNDAEETLIADRQVLAPAWSPDGTRLAFGSAGPDGGVWVVGADGAWPQPAGTVTGVPAWSPDGTRLLIADADGGDGGYNGDPDRLGERRAGDVFRAAGRLRSVAVPVAPGAGAVLALRAVAARPDRNAAAYDRVWTRVARLYYGLEDAGGPDAAARAGESAELRAWREVGLRHRAAALTAPDDTALEDVIWTALRERPSRAAARGGAGVSSAHPLATAAGVEILEAGGNVVDAAVAVSFALGVVEPDASGVGGYGEMVIHVEGMEEPTSIEFMTRVPEAATLDNPAVAAIPRSGPGVANVPGTVAGMELAWRRYGSGRVSWARLVEPAIRLAEEGFVLDDGFATTLRRERERFAEHESSRALFFRDGEPLGAGDTLRNPDLAWTLRQIAEGGADAFYRGAVAERMVADLAAGGNLMSAADLGRYLAAERRPVRSTYRGNEVWAGPPPVTGGAVLLGKLNLLERVPVGGLMTEDAATLHAMLEAWKFQPSTGGRVADPDLWPVDVTPFESKDTAAARWRCFDPSRASVPGALTRDDCGRDTTTEAAPDVANDAASSALAEECLAYDRECRGTGTTAYVVADSAGNIVSVTQTLGTWGGNFYVTPGLGFLYNDKLRSYGSNPAGYNARIPYARNTTVISPTIVFRGSGADRRPWFGVGAAGNAWITAAVYQALVGMVDHGMGPQEALEQPRFLAGRGIQIEDGFAPAVLRELEAMGHSFERISLMGELRMGYGAAVMVRGDGTVEAAGDPRRGGTGGATGCCTDSGGR
jgi:gamma-glutamyltranspeptidase